MPDFSPESEVVRLAPGGIVRHRMPGSGMLPTVGVLANTVYLLLVVLVWIAAFSGAMSV